MKFILTALIVIFSCQLFAQKSFFVRVYDLEGKKINKGQVVQVTDTSLELKGNNAPIIISVNKIGFIKTKRSEGHNVFMGSLISSSIMVSLFVAAANPKGEINNWDVGGGIILGLFFGLPPGALIGALTIPFKKSKTFIINGDLSNWKTFQKVAQNNKSY